MNNRGTPPSRLDLRRDLLGRLATGVVMDGDVRSRLRESDAGCTTDPA
jgi:hypothetical protein